MRNLVVFIALGMSLLLAGCRDKAAELYDTAQLEEQQFNTAHAAQLYREIVEKYPDSPQAGQARQRLEAMEKK